MVKFWWPNEYFRKEILKPAKYIKFSAAGKEYHWTLWLSVLFEKYTTHDSMHLLTLTTSVASDLVYTPFEYH